MQMIFDDTTLNAIASMVLDVQARENTSLPVLKAQLAQTEQGIQNMLNRHSARNFHRVYKTAVGGTRSHQGTVDGQHLTGRTSKAAS